MSNDNTDQNISAPSVIIDGNPLPPPIQPAEPAQTEFTCEMCGSTFSSENALRGHQKAHRAKKMPLVASQSEASGLREEFEKEKAERMLLEEKVKKLEAERKLQSMSAETQHERVDPVDAALVKLLEAKRANILAGEERVPLQHQNIPSENNFVLKQVEELNERLDRENQERKQREFEDLHRRDYQELASNVAKLGESLQKKIELVERAQTTHHAGGDLLISESAGAIKQLLTNLNQKTTLVETYFLEGIEGYKKVLNKTEPKSADPNPDIDELETLGLVKHEKGVNKK